MKKAEYRNAQRSRRLICEALLELLDTKDLSKITVTDIANRADINRGTFYLHFDSVVSVINDLQESYISHMDEYFDSLQSPFSVDNTGIIIARCLEYIYHQHQGRYLPLIFHQQISFADKVCQNLQKRILESADLPKDPAVQRQILVRAAILAHGILGAFHSMSNGSINFSVDDLTEGVDELVRDMDFLQLHRGKAEQVK